MLGRYSGGTRVDYWCWAGIPGELGLMFGVRQVFRVNYIGLMFVVIGRYSGGTMVDVCC